MLFNCQSNIHPLALLAHYLQQFKMIKKLVLLGAALAATAFAGGDDVFDNDAGERYFCPASGASCLPEGQANLFQGAVISGLLVPTITATSQCKEALKNVYAISSSLAASKLQSFSWHKRELGASVSSSGVPPCKKLLLALDAARDSCLEFAVGSAACAVACDAVLWSWQLECVTQCHRSESNCRRPSATTITTSKITKVTVVTTTIIVLCDCRSSWSVWVVRTASLATTPPSALPATRAPMAR